MSFSEHLRNVRKKMGLTQKQLADICGVTQGAITHWETGRRLQIDTATVAALEAALCLPPGSLAAKLPPDHPARLMANSAIPVLGVVAAGPGSEEPANDVLQVVEAWSGCVAYRVRGDSMLGMHIVDGDYLIVRPDTQPEIGQLVVAWLEGLGAVIKHYATRNYLRSTDRWAHKLRPQDRILGVLVGVVRFSK